MKITALVFSLFIACSMAQEEPSVQAAPATISGLTLYQGNTSLGAFTDSTLTSATNYTVKVDNYVNTTVVKWYQDGNLVETDSAPPFERSWRPSNVGTHTFQATGFNGTLQGNSINTTFTVVKVASPTPAPTTTPAPTPPIPTPTPIPTATVTPRPTTTPSPSPGQTRNVMVVVVNPVSNDTYEIYCDGAIVGVLTGGDAVNVPNLNVGQSYRFADRAIHDRVPSVVSNPIVYTVTSATTQEVNIP